MRHTHDIVNKNGDITTTVVFGEVSCIGWLHALVSAPRSTRPQIFVSCQLLRRSTPANPSWYCGAAIHDDFEAAGGMMDLPADWWDNCLFEWQANAIVIVFKKSCDSDTRGRIDGDRVRGTRT